MSADLLPAGGAVRLFVAVDIGDALRQALGIEVDALKRTHPKIKWVSPANVHLTLAFLGDVYAERCREIARGLDAAVTGVGPFTVAVEGLGTFGAAHTPRVVWAGMGQGSDALGRLQARVDEAMKALGFPGEHRPFNAHLTLGRVRFAHAAIGLSRALERRGRPGFGELRVDEVRLMRSELLPQGPRYGVIHAARL
jgi:2'-5' RNA ligase